MEKKTPLYQQHLSLGARMVPFGGYLMPLEYTGIIEEHRAVRDAVGLFDLSHMGEFRVSGPEALAAVDSLMTNDIRGLETFHVRYTPMCYPNGGIVDDLLVYRWPDHLVLVVNASNIEKDLTWIQDHVPGNVVVENVSDEVALIAVQGPASADLLQSATEVDLTNIEYYRFAIGTVCGVTATISRTGYTGEDGFELYLPSDMVPAVWQALTQWGESRHPKPVGLGARDTLRLEAGYMLYGNDIDDSTSPLEAGLGWTVRFGDHDFIGRDALERQRAGGLTRRMVAVEMDGRRIPRPHCLVWSNGQPVGELTSGTFSPTVGHGIGLGYVDTDHARIGTDVNVEIRGHQYPARIVRKPIYKR